MRIEVLELKNRTKNALKRKGINTVEQLLKLSDEDLMKIRHFGVACLTDVHDKIRNPSKSPAVPGPKENDHNIMELCFQNGERHMKEKVIGLLMEHKTVPGGFCNEHIINLIQQVEAL